MKIGILSRKPDLYSTRRLQEACTQMGMKVFVLDYHRCYLNITADKPRVLLGGDVVELNGVIPRIGASSTFYGCSVVRQFELMGTTAVNTALAIAQSRDKLRALQLLTMCGVDVPTTSFARSPKDIKELIKEVGGAPVIIKLLEATQGQGVVLAETYKAAEAVISGFRQLDANILVQEFVKEAEASDIRVIVVGGNIVAAMKRQGPPDEFRSNLHRGGKAEPVELTEAESRAALKSANAVGLAVAGVDILRSKRGPLVLEVNSSPGLQGIEQITGVDVAHEIAKHVKSLVENK